MKTSYQPLRGVKVLDIGILIPLAPTATACCGTGWGSNPRALPYSLISHFTPEENSL